MPRGQRKSIEVGVTYETTAESRSIGKALYIGRTPCYEFSESLHTIIFRNGRETGIQCIMFQRYALKEENLIIDKMIEDNMPISEDLEGLFKWKLEKAGL